MIHLYAQHISAPDLKVLLESQNSNITFKLQSNPYANRSGANPDIVIALIGGSATIIAALIALFGVIYMERKKDQRAQGYKQETEDLKLLVKTQSQQIKDLIQQVGEKTAREITETESGEDVFDSLILSPEDVATVTDPSNPYHAFFNNMPADRVTAIALIEED